MFTRTTDCHHADLLLLELFACLLGETSCLGLGEIWCLAHQERLPASLGATRTADTPDTPHIYHTCSRHDEIYSRYITCLAHMVFYKDVYVLLLDVLRSE